MPGDLLLIFFIWYGLTRFALEGLRTGNWTFFGDPDGPDRHRSGSSSSASLGLLVPARAGPAGRDRAADLLPERDRLRADRGR